MAIVLEPIPGKTIKLLKAEQIVCRDRSHCHRSPIQNMVMLEINGHTVWITQDGERYNARIDSDLGRLDLTEQQLNQYVRNNT